MLSCLRSLPIRSARLWSALGVESGGHQRGGRCVRFVAREPRGGTTCSRRRITPDRALRARNVLRAHSTAPSAQGFRRIGPRFLDGTVSATILAVEPASLQGVHSRIDRPRGDRRRRVRCTCRCNRGRLRSRACQLRSPGAEDLRAVRGPFAASPVIQAKSPSSVRTNVGPMATFVRHALQHSPSRQLRAGHMVDLGHPLKKGGKIRRGDWHDCGCVLTSVLFKASLVVMLRPRR